MDHDPEFCANCKSAAICFNYGCMDEPTVAALSPIKWTAEEIAAACVKAGLGILECNSLMTTLKYVAPSAPGTPEAPAAAEKLYASWQHSQPDRYNIPPWRLLAESVKIEWERRAAAQLDGGQGEGK